MKAFWNNKLYLIIYILSFAFNIYSQDGTIDLSFGTEGWVFASIEERKSGGSDVAVQTDGKIVVIGTYNNGTDDDFIVTRYNDDGTISSETYYKNGDRHRDGDEPAVIYYNNDGSIKVESYHKNGVYLL